MDADTLYYRLIETIKEEGLDPSIDAKDKLLEVCRMIAEPSGTLTYRIVHGGPIHSSGVWASGVEIGDLDTAVREYRQLYGGRCHVVPEIHGTTESND